MEYEQSTFNFHYIIMEVWQGQIKQNRMDYPQFLLKYSIKICKTNLKVKLIKSICI